MSRTKDIQRVENRQHSAEMRANRLRLEREHLQPKLNDKRLSVARRESIAEQVRILDEQIKAAEQEEWDADNERYDLIWHRSRK